VCTDIVRRAPIAGSGKGAGGWFDLRQVTVTYDHPFHALYEHTLNIDFVDESQGLAGRVAVELTAESARVLAEQILAALEAGERTGRIRPPPAGTPQTTAQRG
jgi:hypothetical protein